MLRYQCGEHFDLLPNIVPSKTISQELIVSILQNNGIQSGSLLTLGDNSRKFQEHIAESNDAMIVFLDSTSLDEEKKATDLWQQLFPIMLHNKSPLN